MFKFIHAADIHLDSPLRGLSRYESAPADAIRDACRRAFENLVDLAVEEKAAFVLLAGDLYDGDWKDYSTGIFFSHQLGRLSREGIDVFAVAGNHDAANRMTRSLDGPANLTLLSSRRTQTIRLDGLSVSIHGQSFDARHVDENLAAGFHAADSGRFNIGLLHTSLDGREGHAAYAPCSMNDLRTKGYQYWALGHVHRQEIVSEDPWIVFPGCIQGRHIRETGAKGCVLVSVEDGSVDTVTACPLDVFRWAECPIDLTTADDRPGVLDRIRRTIEDAIASADGRPLALRLRLEGATALVGELSAFPERFEQQIRALGAEIAGDEVWIERVENATTGKRDLESALSDESAFGKLLNDILNAPGRPDQIDGIQSIVNDLRQKLPPEVFGDDAPLALDDPRTMTRLVDEAKQMLIGRLLQAGGH